MPIYTARFRWTMGGALDRGSDYIEQTYHFSYANDDQAHDDVARLIAYTQAFPGSNRWVVGRGDAITHECAMYRRSSASRQSWALIKREAFTMAAWQDLGLGVPDSGITLGVVERPMFPHARGAVLIEFETGDTAVKRRVYLGPVSPINLFASLPGLGYAETLSYTNILNGDDEPFDFDSDSIDRWRTTILDWALSYVAGLDTGDGAGQSVVPSWRHAAVHPVVSVRASYVRAELRSRSTSWPMTERVFLEGGGGGGGGPW